MFYFEDFADGAVIDLGSITVTQAEIISFAEQFDPLPFHTDPTAAGPLGGLIASGWHTGALFSRLFSQQVIATSASAGGTGIDIRLHHPVRPNDYLVGRVRVDKTWPSRKQPCIGTVVFHGELHNQHGQQVMTVRVHSRIYRRPSPDPTTTAQPATPTSAEPRSRNRRAD